MKQEERLKQAIEAYIKDLEDEVVVCMYDRVAGFVDGIIKQRNGVWHNNDDMPEAKKPIITVFDDKKVGIDWAINNVLYWSKVARWAYLDDILPDVEPNKE